MRKRSEPISNAYMVLCCGCTDCFAQAIFADQMKALKWANENCLNPEGFVIQTIYCKEIINACKS